MRDINVVVEISELKTLKVIAVKEKIDNYAVDAVSKLLTVNTSLFDKDEKIISAQTFNFFGKQYVEDPSEEKIYNWIDEERLR